MRFAPQSLFPIFVRQGRSRTRYKVGYINRAGNLAIEPRFDGGDWFSEGLAGVQSFGKWGFIDIRGNTTIEPGFVAVSRFCEGLAATCGGPQKWGYIDHKGHFAIPPQYVVVGDFAEGLAWIRKEQDREGFIDRTGSPVIPAVFKSVRPHSEGLAPVQLGRLWGYVDRNGETVISARFDGDVACSFSEGLSRVKHGGLYGFINRTGKWVVEPRFPFALDFHEGLAVVGKSFEEPSGYINREGDLKIRLSGFVSAKQFSEGLAAVAHNTGSKGFIDTSGDVVISPRFESVRPFCSGLALVTTKKSIGYIDRSGEFIWEGPWVETGFFVRPLPVTQDGAQTPKSSEK